MAYFDTTWYVDSAGYNSISAFAATTYTVGQLVRPSAPTINNERVQIVVIAGTSTTEPTWTTSRGAKNVSNTVTFQEVTGQAAINGDATNTPNWNTVKNQAVSIGQIIKNVAGTIYLICDTAGTAGNGAEPTWNTTAGVTTADNTITWRSLGAVGNFTGGQAPAARLQTMLATNWGAAGNDIWLKSTHAETASVTITIGGSISTAAAPVNILCHNGANYPPTSANITTGASITTTGNTSIAFSERYAYLFGVIFNPGSGSSGSSNLFLPGAAAGVNSWLRCEQCSFRIGTSSTTGRFNIGGNASASQMAEFVNCKVKFGSVSQTINVIQTDLFWRDTGQVLEAGSSVPTSFMQVANTWNDGRVRLKNLDLSQLTGTIIGSVADIVSVLLERCKLNASATLGTTPSTQGGVIDCVQCDSGNTNYKFRRYRYEGTLDDEETVVRTGGASDGTTAASRKIVTTANADWRHPFEAPPIAVWSDTVGSPVTLTVFGISAALPNNDDIWIDVDYLSDASTPLGSKVSGTKSNVKATPSALASDTSVWGGSTTPFKMTATFTPQQKGYVYATVKAAKASTTFYYDHKASLG